MRGCGRRARPFAITHSFKGLRQLRIYCTVLRGASFSHGAVADTAKREAEMWSAARSVSCQDTARRARASAIEELNVKNLKGVLGVKNLSLTCTQATSWVSSASTATDRRAGVRDHRVDQGEYVKSS